jgi:pimeloyl-ACP methyl ester carboxylesterase
LVARWLGMNLRLVDGRFRFGVDLQRIWTLLGAYFDTDAWPLVERAAAGATGPAVHLIIGSSSAVYSEGDRARARALETRSPQRVTVDTVPAGHWVHVDAPDALDEALLRRLP